MIVVGGVVVAVGIALFFVVVVVVGNAIADSVAVTDNDVVDVDGLCSCWPGRRLGGETHAASNT